MTTASNGIIRDDATPAIAVLTEAPDGIMIDIHRAEDHYRTGRAPCERFATAPDVFYATHIAATLLQHHC